MLVFWPHKKVPKKPTFGSPLWTQTIPDCDSIPAIIAKCVSEIDGRGRKIKGLYRVSGVKSKVDKLCSSLEHGSVDNVNLSDTHPNIIANVLKLYLRQLPEPLMTHRLYPEFIRVAKQFPASPNEMNRQVDGENGIHSNDVNSCEGENNSDFSCIELQEIHQLVNLVSRLPKINYLTLAYLMHHLKRISDKSNINCMTSRNLGIVFGPTLMTGGDGLATLVDTVHHTRVIELLITYAHQIFGSPFSVDNLGRIVGFADPRDWDTESDSGEPNDDEDDDEENNVNLQNRELIHQFLTKSPLSPPPLCTSDYNLLRRKSRDQIDLRPGKSMEFLPHSSTAGPVSSDRSQCLWDDPFYDNLPAVVGRKENRSRSVHENSNNNTITLAGQKIIVKSMSRPSLHPVSFSQFDQEDEDDDLDREYLPFSPSPLSPSGSTSNYHQLTSRSLLSPCKSLSSSEVPAVLSQGRSSRSSNTGQSDKDSGKSCNSSGYVTATYSSPGSKVSVATNRPVNSSRSSLKKHQRKDNPPQSEKKTEKEVIVNQSFGSTNSFSSSSHSSHNTSAGSQSTLASSDLSDHHPHPHSTSPISSSSQHHYDVVTDEEGDPNFLIIKQKQSSLRQHPTQQKQSVDYSETKDQLQTDLQSLRVTHNKENHILNEQENAPVMSQTTATKVSINELRRQFFTSQSGGVTNDVRNDLANIEHMNPISRSITSVQFNSNPITQSSSDVTCGLQDVPQEAPQAPLRLKRASTGIHLNVRFSKQVSTAGHMSPTGKWISHTVSTPTKCVKWPTQVHWDVRRKSKDDSDFVLRRKEVTSSLKHSSSLAQTLDRKTAQAKSTTSISTTQNSNNNNNDIHNDKMHEMLKNHPLAAYASIRNNDSISRSRSAHTVSFVPAPDLQTERRPEFV